MKNLVALILISLLSIFTLPIKEQALVVSTKKGVVGFTGCAYPGIVEMLKEGKG